MILNKYTLLEMEPIKDMLREKVQGDQASHGLTEAGYDIRLKQDIHFTSHFDGPQRRRCVCVDGVRHFGRFTLASAIEEFDMPENLLGVVHDKSTWARRGLSVYNTVIEPGWKGFLTLELRHDSEEDLYLFAGTGIAQVLFHSIAVPASYVGRYQNQEDNPVPAR